MTGRRRVALLSFAVAATLLSAGCHPAGTSPGPGAVPTSSERSWASPSHTAVPTRSPSASAAPVDHRIEYVLAISVDGLNPDALRTLGPEGAPTFHRLMREGAYTLNARTEYEQTRTLPDHTSMLTGRRIDAERAGHGVTFDSDNGTTVHEAAGHYVASVFDVVHDRGGSTAMFSAKEKFRFYRRTWNDHGRADTVGRDNGRAKISRVVIDTDNDRLVAATRRQLAGNPPTFTFLHLSLPDLAGHATGFLSADYLAAVRRTDDLLGEILQTVTSRPKLRQHLLVVITADHGGQPGSTSHSDPTALADYRIPFLVWGSQVAAGRDLYGLNPTFRDPGESRPGYAGRQPIRNGDLAGLVTDALKLPPVPGSTLDRPPTLTVVAR